MFSSVGKIQDAVLERYREVARSPAGKFRYPTGREGAEAFGYERALLDAAPARLLESFCGVGNPFALGPIGTGEAVLDVGCGGGLDLYVATALVGEEGRACGIDLSPEMVSRARRDLDEAGVASTGLCRAAAESIPFADATFDVVISNGALNLSPEKERAFREIFRVLRPGGRLQFADIVLEGELPEEIAGSLEAWSD